MAPTYAYNEADAPISANQADLDAEQLRQIAAAAAGAGVLNTGFTGDELQVFPQAAPNMSCRITRLGEVHGPTAAQLWTWQSITTKATITIGAADATNPRWDIVCASLTSDSVTVTAGTPAAIPEEPATPAGSVILAAVYVPANETAIEAANIHDRRVYVGSFGAILLPPVAPAFPAGMARIYGKELAGGGVLPFFKDSLGIAEFPMAGGPVGMPMVRGQLGTWDPYAGGAARGGIYGGTAGGGERGTPADGYDTTHGIYRRFTTGAVAGNDAGIQLCTAGSGPHVRGIVNVSLWKFRLPAVTFIRFFVGLCDQTLETMVGSDTPAGSFVGFSFSTDRGDANWQRVHNDGAGGQTTVNTAIGATTAPLYLFLVQFGAFTLLALFDSTFTELYSVFAGSSNMPGTTTRTHPVVGIETRAAAFGTAITLTEDIPAADAAYATAVTIADGGDGINNSQTSIGINNGTSVENNDIIKVSATGELMKVTAGGGTTTLTVVRGVAGTTPTAASEGAAVIQSGTALVYTSGADDAIVGDLILIDSEKMHVTFEDTTNNILGVTRASMGTTAATHAPAASITRVLNRDLDIFAGRGALNV